MFVATVTDQATNAVKKYYFFNLTGGEYHELLFDGLEAQHNYLVKFAMMDMRIEKVPFPKVPG